MGTTTQAMGSQGIGDSSVPKPPSLSRQGSLYSLTLDEVQNQLGNLGKPLSSMNLDELLRNIWTVEASNVDNGAQNLSQGDPDLSLNRQSSFPLSRDLNRKTVDEVWREIQHGKKRNTEETDPERQNTLGEMTLEDFLVQAGVALDNTNGDIGYSKGVDATANGGPHAQWTQFPVAMFMPGGRKRGAHGDGVVERTVERRHKRMIKNRESAARSRARKQAYTHELEIKVARLEEENERLRRTLEAEKALLNIPPPEPKYQLRRTSSAPDLLSLSMHTVVSVTVPSYP